MRECAMNTEQKSFYAVCYGASWRRVKRRLTERSSPADKTVASTCWMWAFTWRSDLDCNVPRMAAHIKLDNGYPSGDSPVYQPTSPTNRDWPEFRLLTLGAPSSTTLAIGFPDIAEHSNTISTDPLPFTMHDFNRMHLAGHATRRSKAHLSTSLTGRTATRASGKSFFIGRRPWA